MSENLQTGVESNVGNDLITLAIPESVHYLLPEALSSKYLLDKDTFTNPVLFVFWLFSILPYPIKMLGIRFYIFLRRFYK